jgi:hypothetical protein
VTTLSRLRARLESPAEDLAWLLVLAAAVALAVGFIWITPSVADLYPSPAGDLFATWRVAVDPEPLEETRSMLTLATPLILAAILLVFGAARAPRRALDPIVIAIQLAGVALLVIAVLRQQQTGPLLSPDYFDRYLVSAPNLIAGVIVGILLTALITAPPKRRWPDSIRSAVNRIANWRWLALVLAIAVTAIWLLPAVNTDQTIGQAGQFATGHIVVQGDDYFAAVNGRTPLVDYISQYANLLPILLEPVLRAAGPSFTSLSISLVAVSLVGMMAIYGALAQITRGAWPALFLYVPWVALGLYPWHDAGPHREFNGNYYGVLPGRYFGPFVLALLCAMALRGRRIPPFALFLIAGLVLFNNYEFGLGALLALIVALAAGWDRTVPLSRRLGDLLLAGAGGLISAVALVSLLTLVRTGQLPDLGFLTYYSRLFLGDAFGLQPMPSLGVHWALYGTYSAALLLAAVRYVHRDPDRVLTGMLAFSGVFGLVTGMYFVGRSSQFQLMLLFPAWGLALALLAWAAFGALRSSRMTGTTRRRLWIPASAALIGFGVMVATIDGFPPPLRQVDRLRDGGAPLALEPTERVIEAWTNPGDDILFIGRIADHLVADKAGVVDVSPLNGEPSLFSPAEADRSLDQLEESGGDLVIERASQLPPRGFAFGIPEFATILRERGYRLIAEYPALHLRVWRRASTVEASAVAAARPPHPA